MMQQKKLIKTIALASLGLVYFSYFSNWENNGWLANYLSIIPLQVLAFLYVYFYWYRRKPKT